MFTIELPLRRSLPTGRQAYVLAAVDTAAGIRVACIVFNSFTERIRVQSSPKARQAQQTHNS